MLTWKTWKIKCTSPDNEKPLKNHSKDVAKKNVETYSPSSAEARNLEEEVKINPSLHRNNLTKFENSKQEDRLS